MHSKIGEREICNTYNNLPPYLFFFSFFFFLFSLCAYNWRSRKKRSMQGDEDKSEITFLVEDLEAVLEMNRMLEEENKQLKQEVTRLKAQVSALKAHDNERKNLLWKKIQFSATTEPLQQKKQSSLPQPTSDLPESPAKKDRPEQKRTVAGAAPPPPPPLPSRSLVGARAVKRVPEVIEFYRYLTKRSAQLENKASTMVIPAEVSSRNMIGEIEDRSTYLSAIKSDVETQGELINWLTQEVENAAFKDISAVEAFVKWLDGELSCLVDERAVLKRFPSWPERKADALREAACSYRDLRSLETEILGFRDNSKQSLSQMLGKLQNLQDRLERSVSNVESTREGRSKRYRELQIPWEWMLDSGLIGKIKLSSLKLAQEYMRKVTKELQSPRCSKGDDLVLQGARFAYRAHQFAGGFDKDTMNAFEELKQLYSAIQSNSQ